MELMVAFPLQCWTMLYCWQLSVGQQQYNVTYCCLSVVTVVTRTCQNIASQVYCLFSLFLWWGEYRSFWNCGSQCAFVHTLWWL